MDPHCFVYHEAREKVKSYLTMLGKYHSTFSEMNCLLLGSKSVTLALSNNFFNKSDELLLLSVYLALSTKAYTVLCRAEKRNEGIHVI